MILFGNISNISVMLPEREQILERGRALHMTLEVRPAHEQEAIWREAFKRARSNKDQAGWLLRYSLYHNVGGNLWDSSLHVGEKGTLPSVDEVEQILKGISYPLPREDVADLLRHVAGRTDAYPWDLSLYLAFVRDILGEEWYQELGLKGVPEALKSKVVEQYERAWGFYCQTASRSIYEWTPEELRFRITDMVNYAALASEDKDHSLGTDNRVKFNFTEGMKEYVQLADVLGILPRRDSDPFLLSGHQLVKQVTRQDLFALSGLSVR